MAKESRFGYNRIDRRGLCVWSDVESSKRVLAVASGDVVELIDVAFSEVASTLHFPSPVTALDWRGSLICVGLLDGTISIFESSRPVFTFAANSPVTAISAHPQKPGLVAFATSGGSSPLCVVDLSSGGVSSIDFLSPLNAAITSLVWNPKAAYILAVGSASGIAAVVDIRDDKRREIVRFPYPSPTAPNFPGVAGLVWVAGNAAQLLTAFADALVCVFDVSRPGHGPVRQFTLAHTLPLSSMTVCRSDPSLVLTAGGGQGGQGGQVRVWSANFRDLTLTEFAVFGGGGGSGAVATSAVNPGALALAASDGGSDFLEIRNLCEGLTTPAPGTRRHVPQWLQGTQAAGVAFGFGQRLAVWAGEGTTAPVVSVSVVVERVEAEVSDISEFLMRGDVAEYLRQLASEAGGGERSRLWRALGLGWRATREQVAALMDEDVAAVRRALDVFLGRPVAGEAEAVPAISEDALEDVFEAAARRSVTTALGGGQADGGVAVAVADESTLALLDAAVRVGEVGSAVEVALKCGLFAEALYLGASDAELHQRVRAEFLARGVGSEARRALLGSCVVGRPLAGGLGGGQSEAELVRQISEWPESRWREAVVVAALHGPEASWKRVVGGEGLGDRLAAAGRVEEAAVCWAIGGVVDKLIDLQAREVAEMGELLKRVLVIKAALTGAPGGSSGGALLTRRVKEFAKARMQTSEAEGVLKTLAVLNLPTLNDDMEIRVIKDRIINAGRLAKQYPNQGYVWDPVFDVRPDASVVPKARSVVNPAQHAAVRAPVGGQPAQPQGFVQQPHFQPPHLQPQHQQPQVHQHQPGFHHQPPQVQQPGFHQQQVHQYQQQPQPQHQQQQMHQYQAVQGFQGAQPSFRTEPVAPQAARAPNTPLMAGGPQRGSPAQTPLAVQTSAGRSPPPAVAGTFAGGSYASRGPPTTGGSSTAPQAGAVSLVGGLPTPWPVPTATQQQQWTNSGVVQSPAAPQREAWPAMNAGEVERLRRALSGLTERSLAADGNRKKYEETKTKFEELWTKLERGEVSPTVQAKLTAFAQALETGDAAVIARVKSDLQTWDWETNKGWIMALKLIFPRI